MSKVLENSPVITTQLTAYRFNTINPAEREAYHTLCVTLRETRECFSSIAPTERSKINSGTVQLETRHVFENQWNTTDDSETNPKMRVFDWAESIQTNTNIKQGHYLTLSSEMVEIRKDVAKCGYCGSMHWLMDGLVFCNQCLDSEYLEKKDLPLLLLRPIAESKSDRRKLTSMEWGALLPVYIKAQTINVKTAEKSHRDDIEREYKKSTLEAETRYNGFIWLLDKNVNIKNCIYYSHQNSFCFGWKQPLSETLHEVLTAVLNEFPFAYTIKCSDDKILEKK